ncbi:MAG: hypothetical protein BWY79_01701 [Actinobacteria bacterium ADurb.Bin444]|nr:MAG: hypothetical protein BWY79_01701 [Actinobacteria bacterium ADurb.Bin444]
MEEGGVADDGDLAVFPFVGGFAQGLLDAVGGGDPGPHADIGVQGVEGGLNAQGVATNVAGHEHLEAREYGEDTAMPTAGTQSGRPHGKTLHRSIGLDGEDRIGSGHAGPRQARGHQVRIELAPPRQEFGTAVHLYSHEPDLLFQEGVEFLHHVEAPDFAPELTYQLLGQRVAHAHFQEAGLREGFPGKLVGRTAGHDAHLGVAHLNAVDVGLVGPGPNTCHALFKFLVPRAGETRPERITAEHARGLAFIELLEHLPTDHLHTATAATVVVNIDHQALINQLKTAGVDTGTLLSAGEARRLACNAGIIPMVLAGTSVPLDLGRTKRLFTQAHRIAISRTHQTCAAHGCERPIAWCELHHKNPWQHGGKTDLANAVPLCGHHHRTIHDQRYQHRQRPDGQISFTRRP